MYVYECNVRMYVMYVRMYVMYVYNVYVCNVCMYVCMYRLQANPPVSGLTLLQQDTESEYL